MTYNPRVLLLTNHLFTLAGSEIFLLEMADELCNQSCKVSISANFLDVQFVRSNTRDCIDILDIETVNISDYDLIYCSHQVLSRFYKQIISLIKESKTPLPFFVYGHLSPFEPLETPGPFIEHALAQKVICNSPETLETIQPLFSDPSILSVYPNPAPRAFFEITERKSNTPAKVLAVSNHFPTEMIAALEKLKKRGVLVEMIGRGFDEIRVSANEIEECSAVISIGKTVQYAIAGWRPVYVYDRFGGPGWLNESNFEAASRANFSGRCCNRQINSEELVDEILQYIMDAPPLPKKWIRWRERFHLQSYIRDLLTASIQRHPSDYWQKMMDSDQKATRSIYLEGVMYQNSLSFLSIANRFKKAKERSVRGKRRKNFFLRLKMFIGL